MGGDPRHSGGIHGAASPGTQGDAGGSAERSMERGGNGVERNGSERAQVASVAERNPPASQGPSRDGARYGGRPRKGSERSPPEIGFLDPGVGEKFPGPALEHDPAVLQHIPSPGELKRHAGILLDDQNGGPFPIDFLERDEHAHHQQGS